MKRIRTHYDNLMVARNASDAVIRSAFEALSLQYREDVNDGRTDVAGTIARLNESYAILSDPKRREVHDLWIATAEKVLAADGEGPDALPGKPRSAAQQTVDRLSARISAGLVSAWISLKEIAGAILRVLFVVGVIVGIFFLWDMWTLFGNKQPDRPRLPTQGTETPQAAPTPSTAKYIRPINAPNGHPWPNVAGYLDGYDKLLSEGQSTVTVQNTGTGSDLYVELVAIEGPNAYPARYLFMPSDSKFVVRQLDPGTYEIRYRDLASGATALTAQFTLIPPQMEDRTHRSVATIVLDKVPNGAKQIYDHLDSQY